jgi:unsaturated rhamnogalacturonyl hydrolase
MKPILHRRDFIRTTTALAGSTLACSTLSADHASQTGSIPIPDPDALRIKKVKLAMLAMQRRAWEQGTASQALLEMGEIDLVVQMAHDAVVNQLKDGRLGVNDGNYPVCDPCSNGEAVLFAASHTGDSFFTNAAGRMLDFIRHKAPRNRNGILYHNMNENQVWVDAIYMLPPYLVVAGEPDMAMQQVAGMRRILQHPSKVLYSHIWDEDLQSFPRRDIWGTGNGWAMAGMARMIRSLPASMQEQRTQLIAWAIELIEAALPYRRSDGQFHDVLDDPQTFVETNFAQMLAYTLYLGMQGGWLPSTYRETAASLRETAVSKVDAHGLVREVCGAPRFDKLGTSTEAQAFFLLMEAARKNYLKARHSAS